MSEWQADALIEKKKRRKEFGTIIGLLLLFLILTWVEFKLFDISRSLPVVHSVFFFGLVNFNIILFLLLFFLIFRNIVKVFSEKEGGLLGNTLKGKLIAAFVGFSVIPTTLIFLVSVFYINNSFDKWFSEKMSGVLKSSLEVTNAYYVSAKHRNYHFAQLVAQELEQNQRANPQKTLDRLQKEFRLDSVEFYPGVFGDRAVSISKEDNIPAVPEVAMEFRLKGIKEKSEASFIHQFNEGNLMRVIVPVRWHGGDSAVVVSSFVPMSLIAKMDDIASAYEDFRDLDPLTYPLKSIYLIMLVLMTLVIILGATWFGFYLAKQLSVPIELLARAAKRVSQGDYTKVRALTGSREISVLVENFNRMTSDLEKSQNELFDTNEYLQQTLNRLDEHSKYLEVVLTSASTGVISINNKNEITTINNHASQLLGIDTDMYVGRQVKDILKDSELKMFESLMGMMRDHQAQRIQKELRINIRDKTLLVQLTLSLLKDEKGQEIGKVVVFDDMSPVLNAQRAAAWTEVARRIAHEIKNPLTPISLAAQRLQKKFSDKIDDPALMECTTMIIDQVNDLKHLVNEFSQFARMPKTNPRTSLLNPAIEEALTIFREGHRNIEFQFEPDTNIPAFLFDPDQIKRALTNLIDNAIDAVQNAEAPKVIVRSELKSTINLVQISVEDNGAGIENDVLARIFEPYMTTKDYGTGLGLAIVKRTVEDHNGYVRAFSQPNKGTRILIELPLVLANTDSKVVRGTTEGESPL